MYENKNMFTSIIISWPVSVNSETATAAPRPPHLRPPLLPKQFPRAASPYFTVRKPPPPRAARRVHSLLHCVLRRASLLREMRNQDEAVAPRPPPPHLSARRSHIFRI
ncbi:hypothetical protein EVAR_24162_1 [Eumeta japonica]|uniref:Uncharacterized protein n=1 Tax=Eumeta variegata TaxID=151549 RepID=A0A4C1W613_EUMVA|nr:hypothetical protein EVAR_24162_1 [Eumeta japonica]